ncbi:Phosphopantetheine adenylyltransferase [Candidatus Kinetoplastibacterium sorsogonicusi]|uniref:Phosphopantetheine adenylyltransferase n=1 Tax=Candidatus Kinetoplastidibacterium kentomonadis TaxID=1576550 RepID=A0A3Q8ER16_9PROT|nr:pantetheine-phosphate adenylyltransferase [Candidatus Kinetoplastibacterium sorsogonicusi]AWD32245.1 Phosphopantetheine adenylyltransferase [Candidatus Kinetoplastibacterium sorsogonicusi]
MKIAIYPGTFDPFTKGHEDIVRRSIKLFDKVIVGIAISENKKPFFNLLERIELTKEILLSYNNVEICGFDILLSEFAKKSNANVIIRGLRAISDFEYEGKMAGMNRYMMPDIETIFMTPSDKYQFISSSMVREISRLGGNVDNFVHKNVIHKMKIKFSQINKKLLDK